MPEVTPLLAIDAFAGAGGASCGLRDAGFDVHALEKWADAADTHDANHDRPVMRIDLSMFDWCDLKPVIDGAPWLLWAPPPLAAALASANRPRGL